MQTICACCYGNNALGSKACLAIGQGDQRSGYLRNLEDHRDEGFSKVQAGENGEWSDFIARVNHHSLKSPGRGNAFLKYACFLVTSSTWLVGAYYKSKSLQLFRLTWRKKNPNRTIKKSQNKTTTKKRMKVGIKRSKRNRVDYVVQQSPGLLQKLK